MKAVPGYYFAIFAGTADPGTVLWFDGKQLFMHGQNEPVGPDVILFVDDRPLDMKTVGGLGRSATQCDSWLEQRGISWDGDDASIVVEAEKPVPTGERNV